MPLRFGNSVPAPIPSSTIPGSHSPTKSGVIPTRSTNHITAAPQNKPPRNENGAGADALCQPARRHGNGNRDDRADCERQASLEDRVSP